MARIDDVLAPGFLEGLEGWNLEDVRARREDAEDVGDGLSFLRRMVQGRLDIVLAVQARGRSGEPQGDLHELVEQLPSILGEHVHAPGLGRLAARITPAEPDPEHVARLEATLPTARIPSLPELSDDELERVANELHDLERWVSGQRKAVYAVTDRLEQEIVRRYKSGEATVDGLLR